MHDWQLNLVAYGTHLLASQLGQPWPPPGPDPPQESLAAVAQQRAGMYGEEPRLKLASNILPHIEPVDVAAERPVASVFELLEVRAAANGREGEEAVAPAETPSLAGLWGEFWDQLRRLTAASQFDSFHYLLARYGRSVPGSLSDPARSGFEIGLSVAEQFKGVAALCHCLDPGGDEHQSLGLVAGDLPGIQRTLYTLTSQGAAKTLRGRSAYLQLLSDAILRYLLGGLNLPWVNAVYNAGGNFLLLIRGGQEATVGHLGREVNRKLLELHRGELHVALGHVEIEARLVADTTRRPDPNTLMRARQELRRKLLAAKDSPFADLALHETKSYSSLFDPFGQGGPAYTSGERGNMCIICHTEGSLEAETLIPIYAESEDEESAGPEIEMVLCEQCHSLGSHRVEEDNKQEILPYQLTRAEALFVRSIPPQDLDQKYLGPGGGAGNPAWDAALRTFGFDYEFRWPDKNPPPDSLKEQEGYLLYLNRDRFLAGAEPGIAYGFWPLSRLTPWQDKTEDTIRDFHVMAGYDAAGLPRYGVLRMDTDDLGRTFLGNALPYADLLHLSAFSAALNEFFGEQLEAVCRRTVETWKDALGSLDEPGDAPKGVAKADRKVPYIIYAGGDDMLIVGAWDLLPPLAQAIRSAFQAHTCGRLTMSAGISLAREKYPLYKAAEDAGAALDEAKSCPGKNAVTFLGKTLAWNEADDAQKKALALAELIALGVEENGSRRRAPHALLGVLGYIAYLYHQEAGLEVAASHDQVALGRWLWALHYGLRRMGQRVGQPLRREIYALAGDVILNINDLERARSFRAIRYLDVAVRWAEFLIRKGDRGQWTNSK